MGVYKFAKAKFGHVSRTDKFAMGKFRSLLHSKEGYTIHDCKSDMDRRLLEFMISLLYSGKPSQITVIVANTIFEALGGRIVNWEEVIYKVVAKLMENVSWSKTSLISPYLFCLYHFCNVLDDQETVAFNTGVTML